MHCVCDEVKADGIGYTLDHHVEVYPAKTAPLQSKVLSHVLYCILLLYSCTMSIHIPSSDHYKADHYKADHCVH